MLTVNFALVLGVALVSAGPLTDDSSASDIVIDEMLRQMSEDMAKKGLQKIPIDDINMGIGKKIGFLDMIAALSATNGWLEDITTIQRVGPSTLDTKATGIMLNLTVGLDTLEFGFDNVYIDVLSVRSNATLDVTVANNEGNVQLEITSSGDECKTIVNTLEISNISGFTVALKGQHKKIDWITNKLSQFILEKYNETLKSKLSTQIKANIEEALAKNDFCKTFTG